MDVINLEVRLFLASVAWGLVLVVMYDCLRIFRRLVKHNKIGAGLEDVLYWVISAILIFRMMYRVNDGAIRGFSIVGVVIGMVLYHYSISEFVVKMLTKVVQKGFVIGKKVVHIILKPVVWLTRRFRWLFVFFMKIFHKPLRWFQKTLKKIGKQVKIAVVKK